MKSKYPSWATPLTPELEEKEPIREGTLWLHPRQFPEQLSRNYPTGNEIYGYLKEKDELKYCVSLNTLQFYEKHPKDIPVDWKGKFIYAWKSVVRGDDGSFNVPLFVCDVDEPCVGWSSLDDQWLDYEPALRSQVSPDNSESVNSSDTLKLEDIPTNLPLELEINRIKYRKV